MKEKGFKEGEGRRREKPREKPAPEKEETTRVGNPHPSDEETQAELTPQEMIDSLSLEMNKVRQEGITNELLDLVGGVAALEG